MTKPVYRCPLTAQIYRDGEAIFFRLARSGTTQERERKGVLIYCKSGAWKVIAKIGKCGEILPIAESGRAAAPQTIRKA